MNTKLQFFNQIEKWAGAVSSAVGAIVAWLTLVMMLLMTLVVVLRYVFGVGSIALQESVLYLHAVVLMLGMASTLKQDEHVRVDIFYRRFKPANKALVNLVGHLIFLIPICLFIIIMSWDYVLQSWRILEGSQEAGGLPLVFALKSLLFIMPVLLIVQSIADISRYVSNRLDGSFNTDRTPSTTGGAQ